MANDAYLKALQVIKRDDRATPATTLTRTEIEAQIAEVSAALKGPMSNLDRLDAIEAREMLRKQLRGLPCA